MLLRNLVMTDTLYDPLNHLTQTELMEKFNLAFYEAQNLSKTDILSTFNEPIEDSHEETGDDYLIDYLISEENPCTPETTADFDLDDFVEDFCQNIKASDNSVQEFDTETYTTENSSDHFGGNPQNFYVSPPLIGAQEVPNSLPPVATIIRNNFDFNNYIRTVPTDDLDFTNQNNNSRPEFGHLINEESYQESFFDNPTENHMILTQNEAILNDDPLLSSSNIVYPSKRVYHSSESCDEFFHEVSCSSGLLCKWEDCYKSYESQTTLVRHIEKCHVELKRGHEFTCFWENCPRKTKPFNARYKLLIHMRVHSGEKPNKCPFKGCNKAFSRLENLKIHQRSHTGERPYLCQFPSCSKSFSNSSDRAKHQRTHFDTKPYACQVTGCPKKYTDPSSLRKHVKNHSYEEQMQIKKKTSEELNQSYISTSLAKKFFDPSRQKAIKSELSNCVYNTNVEHSYSNTSRVFLEKKIEMSCNIRIKQEIKNKLSEKSNRLKRNLC